MECSKLFIIFNVSICVRSYVINELNQTVLRVGFISPFSGIFGFETTAAATTLAVDNAHHDGYLTDVDVEINWKNGACDGKLALGVTVELRDEKQVDAYIGLPCSEAAINAGKLISYWNLPHTSYSSPDPILADRVTYDTLIRTISPFNNLAKAMVEVFTNVGWHRVVILSGYDPDDYCDYASRSVNDEFEAANIYVAEWIAVEQITQVSDENLHNWLNQIRDRGRIVLVCFMPDVIRRLMLMAHEMGLTHGDYVYIYPTLLPAENSEHLWVNNDEFDDLAEQAYLPLLQITLAFVQTPEAEEFRQEIPVAMALPPWNYTYPDPEGVIGSVYALYLHDAVYLYMMAVDEVYSKYGTSEQLRNGTLIWDISRRKTFDGKSGQVVLDEAGDRIGEYTLWQLSAEERKYTKWSRVNVAASDPQEVYQVINPRDWGEFSGADPPPDTPICGFYGELCPQDTSTRDNTIIGVTLGVVLVSAAVGVGVLMYRRKKFEEDLELMLWKVKYEDVIPVCPKGNGSILGSAMMSRRRSIGKESSHSTVVSHSRLQVCQYKGSFVAVKNLNRSGLLLSREDHLELKNMKDLNHDNINPFVGMCVEVPNICILTKYCVKGALNDILENDNLKLDIGFKSSFIADLINGLEYIHKSALKSHGRLKSSNCVLDGRWVVKLTDFGLGAFRDDPTDAGDVYRAMLWTAPELLRDSVGHRNGTQKGDIYSLAIILQEIIYRCGPYETLGELPMVPKDLCGRIRNGETPAYRPQIPPSSGNDETETGLVEIMRECWEEDVTTRPDISAVRSRFMAINKGQRVNIMDNMIRMLEKYANNLEEIVDERTRQLSEEKKKTEILLHRMLPASVADSLKSGKPVQPRLYQSATVYFSDVVQFTSMASQSTPMEIIDFLNDLWTVFDDVIEKYRVYKVETIGDAYMVVSGLPDVYEDHVAEICDMSLEILSSVITFRVRHIPEKQLQVRIGLHTGACASGVVGLTMPRYCLFGDTVNMASRMESTGEAQRIQISGDTEAVLRAKGGYHTAKRGEVAVKGKGMQTTYFLYGKDGYTRPLPDFTPSAII